jgi:hypothetical protein
MLNVPSPNPAVPPPGVRNVVINAVRLRDDQVAFLEQAFRTRIADGSYWYDKMCGAWGVQNGPTVGTMPPGMDLGGPLRPEASAGNTGVFINGRNLPMQEVMFLQQLVPVMPGRYWLDAAGNCGYEGNPMPVVNLMQLMAARNNPANMGGMYGGNFYRNDTLGHGCGSDGKTSYVMGKDFSVIVGE